LYIRAYFVELLLLLQRRRYVMDATIWHRAAPPRVTAAADVSALFAAVDAT
jgi:hypothetical protein